MILYFYLNILVHSLPSSDVNSPNIYCHYIFKNDTVVVECITTFYNDSNDTLYYPLRDGQDVDGNFIYYKYHPMTFALSKKNEIEIPSGAPYIIKDLYKVNPYSYCIIQYRNSYYVEKNVNKPVFYLKDLLINDFTYFKTLKSQQGWVNESILFSNVASNFVKVNEFKISILKSKIIQIEKIN